MKSNEKNRIICVRLEGGLGNQLFQFAFGYSVSKKVNKILIMDTSQLDKKIEDITFRKFSLNFFDFERTALIGKYFILNRFTIKILKIFPSLNGCLRIFIEKDYADEVAFKHYKYFVGYWQSPKYFDGVEGELFEILSNHNELSAGGNLLLKEIKDAHNSVMIHIRRGDYVTNKSASDVHGVLSLKYYEDAISHMINELGSLSLFVFSDDVEWVKKNFQPEISSIKYIENYGARADWEDLILMSYCKNQVIANSTFSWWSAWLSDQRFGKGCRFVFAPRKWFNSVNICNDTRFPEHWIIK